MKTCHKSLDVREKNKTGGIPGALVIMIVIARCIIIRYYLEKAVWIGLEWEKGAKTVFIRLDA